MADEPVEFVTQKSCILKASIHCEGCKRKVKKILSQVQGVEFVEVDTKQHKVTVTGNVDADALIKKLIKSGKNAELWPQVSQKRDKITANENQREKEVREVDHAEPPPPSSSDNGKVLQGSMKIETPSKIPLGSAATVEAGEGGSVKSNGGDANPPSVKTRGDAKETNPEEEEEEEEKKSGESCSKKEVVEKSTDKGGNGTSGKKKKKEQTGNVSAIVDRGLQNREDEPPSVANEIPPPNHQFPFMPPQPLYAVSYNTAYPTSSHTESYYAAPPPHAYAYMHPGHDIAPPPPLDLEFNPRQPLDSFEMFSDENPNGCFIM